MSDIANASFTPSFIIKIGQKSSFFLSNPYKCHSADDHRVLFCHLANKFEINRKRDTLVPQLVPVF